MESDYEQSSNRFNRVGVWLTGWPAPLIRLFCRVDAPLIVSWRKLGHRPENYKKKKKKSEKEHKKIDQNKHAGFLGDRVLPVVSLTRAKETDCRFSLVFNASLSANLKKKKKKINHKIIKKKKEKQ